MHEAALRRRRGRRQLRCSRLVAGKPVVHFPLGVKAPVRRTVLALRLVVVSLGDAVSSCDDSRCILHLPRLLVEPLQVWILQYEERYRDGPLAGAPVGLAQGLAAEHLHPRFDLLLRDGWPGLGFPGHRCSWFGLPGGGCLRLGLPGGLCLRFGLPGAGVLGLGGRFAESRPRPVAPRSVAPRSAKQAPKRVPGDAQPPEAVCPQAIVDQVDRAATNIPDGILGDRCPDVAGRDATGTAIRAIVSYRGTEIPVQRLLRISQPVVGDLERQALAMYPHVSMTYEPAAWFTGFSRRWACDT
ncbi:hypothetical protein SAMN05443287_103653 [Micromonospora phaseoli]|uniref:Uncharacterized protein n=1 Tax=Micromonospora phaseoli TaxID=1144548 RepID=A0A1H6XVK6_9ACTN|nr:hypothetical protein CLV64_102651 [Micromonospora phaseoli]SEJ28890.1 hypothetical protein SAMN05443287_103653 [Micromonospora phaseoli]